MIYQFMYCTKSCISDCDSHQHSFIIIINPKPCIICDSILYSIIIFPIVFFFFFSFPWMYDFNVLLLLDDRIIILNIKQI